MTKGDIDRLGQRIGASVEVEIVDLNMLQDYRQTFQDPISRVFNFVLTESRQIDKNCIVTYRIKRIDTIVEKLHRFHQNTQGPMQLSRMWDIAGCRCIFNSHDNGKLYKLLDVIRDEFGNDCKVKDYIKTPKSSGYRSIHIYVKDALTNKPVEIQIRNQEQHNWATLVEIVDLLYGTKNKEHGAINRLGRFLYLYSHASDLDEKGFAEMLKTERRMKIFERMSRMLTSNYLSVKRQWLKQNRKGSYFVITANKNGSEILSFPSFKEAESTYYEKYLSNSDSNIVLTHLKMPNFEQINMAYSNYVLAMHAFFDEYRNMVSKRIIHYVRDGAYIKVVRYFNYYNNNVKCHFQNLSLELKGINSCYSDLTITKNQIGKWVKEIKNRLQQWVKETDYFFRILGRETRGDLMMKMLLKSRIKHMIKAVSEGQKSLIL